MGLFEVVFDPGGSDRLPCGCNLKYFQDIRLKGVVYPLPERRVFGSFGGLGDAGCYWIQVNVGARREQSLLVKDRDRLVASLPECAAARIFLVGKPCKRLS